MGKYKRILALILGIAMIAGLVLPLFVQGAELPETVPVVQETEAKRNTFFEPQAGSGEMQTGSFEMQNGSFEIQNVSSGTQAGSSEAQTVSSEMQNVSSGTQNGAAGTQGNDEGTSAGSDDSQAGSSGTQAGSSEMQNASSGTQNGTAGTQSNDGTTTADAAGSQAGSGEAQAESGNTQAGSSEAQNGAAGTQGNDEGTSAGSDDSQVGSSETQNGTAGTQSNDGTTSADAAGTQSGTGSPQETGVTDSTGTVTDRTAAQDAGSSAEESAEEKKEEKSEEKTEENAQEETLLEEMALEDANIAGGEYIFHSAVNDSFVLDIAGGKTANKANVQIYSANGSDAQVFKITANGDGTYTITNRKSSKVLDAAGGKTKNGTNVWQYKGNGSNAQKWRIVPSGSFVEIRSEADNNAALDIYGGKAKNKRNVQLWKANGTNAQKWRLEAVNEAVSSVISSGTYEVASALNTDYVLDIYGASAKAAANLQIYKANGSAAQQFTFTDMGLSAYVVTNAKSGLAIQAAGESHSSGANVRQEEKSFTGIQKWTIEKEGEYYRIRNSVSGMYLTVEGNAANGANVGQASKKTGSSQLFVLNAIDEKRNFPDGMYTIVSGIDGMAVIEADKGKSANGTNIQLGTQNGGSSQKFLVTYKGDGYYSVVNVNANKALDVYGGKDANKTNVQIWKSNNSKAQQWAFVKEGSSDASYALRSALGSRVLDVKGGKAAAKTNIQIYKANHSKAQQWLLRPTTKQSKGAYYPDISHYEPVQDWSLVRENCPFMISKATQGVGDNSMIDSTLEEFISGCEENKIPYYLYVFLNVGNEKAQAEYMVSVCKPLVGPYFRGYAVDIESGNTAAAVKEALDYIKTQSKKCLLYTNWTAYYTYKSVIESRGSNVAWWEARYGYNTGELSMLCHDEVDLHQYTSKGTCPGIGESAVDMNRLTGTKPESWFTNP